MNDTIYSSFIEQETARMKKAARTTWIAGAIILVLLFAYFSFILTMVKAFTKPENAAFLVADSIKTNFPSFIETTEELMAERSIYLANDLSSAFIDSVPQLREEAEAQIEYTYTDMIPHVSKELQSILNDYIRENEEEIRLLAEQDTSAEFTDAFITELMGLFSEYMNEYMSEGFEGRDLQFVQENSLIGLQSMNTYLDELISMPASEMTRIQALQKQLLTSVTRRVIEE